MSGSRTDEAKGRAKQALGDLLDDDELRQEGRADQAGAKVKHGMDVVKDKVEDGISDLSAAKEKLQASHSHRS